MVNWSLVNWGWCRRGGQLHVSLLASKVEGRVASWTFIGMFWWLKIENGNPPVSTFALAPNNALTMAAQKLLFSDFTQWRRLWPTWCWIGTLWWWWPTWWRWWPTWWWWWPTWWWRSTWWWWWPTCPSWAARRRGVTPSTLSAPTTAPNLFINNVWLD